MSEQITTSRRDFMSTTRKNFGESLIFDAAKLMLGVVKMTFPKADDEEVQRIMEAAVSVVIDKDQC